MLRRAFLGTLGASILSAGLSKNVFAQQDNGLKLVIPFPAGGGGDVLGRSPLDKLSANLGRDIWVQNRPGAGGNIGITHLIEENDPEKAFGYVTNGIMCVNPYLYSNMRFNPLTDLIPVGQLSKVGLVMLLNPKAIKGVTDFASFADYSRKHPGDVFFASSGVGTTSHLAGQFLAQQTGLAFTHVPHAGGAAAMVEVLSGRIPFMIDVIANALPHIKSGALKPLGVTTAQRLAACPDVPTMQELGIKDYELCAWDGYVVTKGAKPEIVQNLSNAIASISSDPMVKERIEKMGAEPVFSDAQEFKNFIDSEAPKWKSLAQSISRD